MKRTKKLLVLAVIIGCLAGIGTVLTKVVRHTVEPFPGSRVVLDDASWRSLWQSEDRMGGYHWVAPNLLVCSRWVGGAWQFTLRRYLPKGTVSPLQPLTSSLPKGEKVDSISPDGITLCLWKTTDWETYTYRLVRLDGDGKPITFTSRSYEHIWSPDSRFLYGITETTKGQVLERIDARTGILIKTPVTVPEGMEIHSITPDGTLRFFSDDTEYGVDSPLMKWRIGELQGSTVHAASYQKRFSDGEVLPFLSPDGKRLLWLFISEENTLWERIQNKVLRKKIPPKSVMRWQITDADGSNPRTLGSLSEKEWEILQGYPRWTPDSKGVYFVYEKKLWRLDVP
jgi:hypothetical protein